MSTVRLIVTIGIAWILSLALAIFVVTSIHRVLSTRPRVATRSSARLPARARPLRAAGYRM